MTQAVEQHEFDPAGSALLVEAQRAQKAGVVPFWRLRDRQAGALDQALQARRLVGRESSISGGQASRCDHTNRNRLAVQVAAVTRARFDCMADGMAEVQGIAQAALALVGADDGGL